ncbi:hypothetical protein [Alicyclobacillus fodiniaquatilis]|uniref:Uncharacterized protein n=1 Tax=Alicyclobacillus fodiniaquatilis TaxID=1661150 RepID=A0ABW4JCN7_9BACL
MTDERMALSLSRWLHGRRRASGRSPVVDFSATRTPAGRMVGGAVSGRGSVVNFGSTSARVGCAVGGADFACLPSGEHIRNNNIPFILD